MAAAPPPCASRRSFRDSPKVLMAAAARAVTRAPGRAATQFVQTRLRSSGGKVLGDEEKAAENVYIKKMEQEKLEKLARKVCQHPVS
ncbi:hypothetical protein ZWY2020_060020 [Hordeum vulgare]|nr:hypothetical protein ZWY2020_060020 [Hordeum vulgare]